MAAIGAGVRQPDSIAMSVPSERAPSRTLAVIWGEWWRDELLLAGESHCTGRPVFSVASTQEILGQHLLLAADHRRPARLNTCTSRAQTEDVQSFCCA